MNDLNIKLSDYFKTHKDFVENTNIFLKQLSKKVVYENITTLYINIKGILINTAVLELLVKLNRTFKSDIKIYLVDVDMLQLNILKLVNIRECFYIKSLTDVKNIL